MTAASLPITAFYTGLCALFLVVLIYRVIAHRRSKGIGIGDGNDDALALAMRAHGNFVETAPFGLLLILVNELNGTQIGVLHLLGMMLIIGRCAHAWGISRSSGASVGRFAGMVLTLGVFLIGAVAALITYLDALRAPVS